MTHESPDYTPFLPPGHAERAKGRPCKAMDLCPGHVLLWPGAEALVAVVTEIELRRLDLPEKQSAWLAQVDLLVPAPGTKPGDKAHRLDRSFQLIMPAEQLVLVRK